MSHATIINSQRVKDTTTDSMSEPASVAGDQTPATILHLRNLAIKIASSLEELRGHGIASRSTLENLRSCALSTASQADVDELFLPLVSRLDESVARKAVQLETEAVEVDALLEVRLGVMC